MKRQLSKAINCRHGSIILLSSNGGIANREIAWCVGCTPQWVRIIIHRTVASDSKRAACALVSYQDVVRVKRPAFLAVNCLVLPQIWPAHTVEVHSLLNQMGQPSGRCRFEGGLGGGDGVIVASLPGQCSAKGVIGEGALLW